ncbi:hypothetical protein V3M78_06710 [Trueperella pyogenes]|uniref:hypothetical protein n=1 Tax=Trueperella pyogenes TaxID=1661 RepID=UPI0024C00D2D|nr:hypothetical protein [Trueperella pyogenes]WHU57072.1 hypothetical protein QEV10_10135 [Trueperella pyogenes]
MIDLNDVLADNGGKTLKPETIGETLGGVIASVDVRQMTDFTTSKPEFWDDGKPKNQIVVTVKTGAVGDDGEPEQGNVYIKTWGEQKIALSNAIKATGLDANGALAPGNEFWVTYRGEKPNEKNPRFNATKIYEYKIVPRADLGGVLDENTAPATAPATPDNPVSLARQLINAGLDDTSIATATGLEPSVINALRAA